jgi:two-component system CheB/CheR fusion protein
MLALLLSRTTAMPVMEVQHGTRVRPTMFISYPAQHPDEHCGRILELKLLARRNVAPRPIDYFFRSLAVDQKRIAIGVVLSGADPMGLLGLQAIGEGGIAIVQSGFRQTSDMPRTAIAAGTVDLILAEEIAGELAGLTASFPSGRAPAIAPVKDGGDESQLNRIFASYAATSGLSWIQARDDPAAHHAPDIQRAMRSEAYISDLNPIKRSCWRCVRTC